MTNVVFVTVFVPVEVEAETSRGDDNLPIMTLSIPGLRVMLYLDEEMGTLMGVSLGHMGREEGAEAELYALARSIRNILRYTGAKFDFDTAQCLAGLEVFSPILEGQ